MTPVMATEIDHNPAEGRFGDCHSACIATLLDLPRDQVPLFFDDRPAKECWAHVEEFLRSFDLVPFDVVYPTKFSLEEVLLGVSLTAPGCYYILCVKVPCGLHHSVVCCDDEVVHDPTPGIDADQYGTPDGAHWCATFMVPRGLTRR